MKYLLIFLFLALQGCNPITFEYFDIEPKSNTFYKDLLVKEIKVNPSFRPLTETIINESLVKYTGPYMVMINVSDGINEKSRTLEAVHPLNVYIEINDKEIINKDYFSDGKNWSAGTLPESFYSASRLDLKWEKRKKVRVIVKFKGIFKLDGKTYEKIYQEEIEFIRVHNIQNTNGFTRLVV